MSKGKKNIKNSSKNNVKKTYNEDGKLIVEEIRGSKQCPYVSVICPTYNRRRFLPNLIHQFMNQTYPQMHMELVILDDSTESNNDIIPQRTNIKYHYKSEKMILGYKRNYLNTLTSGDIIVCFDDDDFYSPERVAHAVHTLTNSKCLIAASSIIHIYYKQLDAIMKFGPYAPNHGTNGTMAYKKEYLRNHGYLDDKEKAEEAHFTNNFSEPLVQLNPHKVMICLAHAQNTVSKDPFIEKGVKTTESLRKFFKEKDPYMINWIKNNL